MHDKPVTVMPKRIPFTKSGFEKILAEKAKLEAERPEAVENLRKAREMGDLSENGYYKAARQRLSFLDGRLRHLSKLAKLAKIVETTSSDTIQIGNKVVISDGQNKLELMIVGGYESNPAMHTVSYLSPIGKALMGKRPGDLVIVAAPAGQMQYQIVSITA
jgi:transcription elongation factor GreA